MEQAINWQEGQSISEVNLNCTFTVLDSEGPVLWIGLVTFLDSVFLYLSMKPFGVTLDLVHLIMNKFSVMYYNNSFNTGTS